MKNIISVVLLFLLLAGFSRCSKKDVYVSEQPADYMNLVPGKFNIYRLDSFKYVQYGQKDTIISYQAMDVVDSQLTDNLGNTVWRIQRFLNDTLTMGPWIADVTYYVTITKKTLDVTENGLRFEKLSIPIANDFSWKGNSYINTVPPASTATEPDLSYFDNWDYTYANVGQSYTLLNNSQIDHTITINQRDETLGTPGDLDSYGERNYSVEVYGKGIGLIYKNFLHWTFQQRDNTYPNGYYDGYGITLSLISHN
jgi:hypothetical protein